MPAITVMAFPCLTSNLLSIILTTRCFLDQVIGLLCQNKIIGSYNDTGYVSHFVRTEVLISFQ